ncbi:MAG: metallophosphoesterase [Spirochaetales bacterium]|nr:metallophosphoesterase [Spirochaetales bacterium]
MARSPIAGKVPAPTGTLVDPKRYEGLALVERAIEVALSYPGRPKDSLGRPGGLLDLPVDLKPIIVGDLHANVEHLKAILKHHGNEDGVAAGKACVLIVGDTVHDDRTGCMKDMTGSLSMLEEVLSLLVRYPGRIYYLKGNHDTFDERLRKSGIAQGMEFRKALQTAKGADYVAAVQRFFDSLPQFAIGPGFVVTHAGPPRGGCDRRDLIDIASNPDLQMQLMWNRVNEFHGMPSAKEYGAADIAVTLERLGLPADTHFIVGHNPLWGDGGRTGVWPDVIGIKHHHIIYSGSGSRAPYFTLENGHLVVRLSVDPEPEVYYYG